MREPEGTIRMGLVAEVTRVGCASIAAAVAEGHLGEASALSRELHDYLRHCAKARNSEGWIRTTAPSRSGPQAGVPGGNIDLSSTWYG